MGGGKGLDIFSNIKIKVWLKEGVLSSTGQLKKEEISRTNEFREQGRNHGLLISE